jgi:Response regulator of the LytR/AlgR family
MKRTAILIDDDPLVHKDVRFRLKSLPRILLIATYSSTDEALEYIESHGYVDLIFCDILMPGKDGYEANRLLAGCCNLFVFLTQKETHGPEIFTTASMVHYLRKPIDVAAVSLLLERLDHEDRKASEGALPADVLFVYDRISKNRVSVELRDIMKISFGDKYGSMIVAGREDRLLVYGTVSTTLHQLREVGWFIRISRNTIISRYAIEKVDPQLVVYFKWGGYEAVKRTYQPLFREFMKQHKLG